MQPYYQVRHFFESEQAQRGWADARSGEAKALSGEEFAEVLAAIGRSRHPLRNRALFLLSFLCGLRVGEIAQLRLLDVQGPTGLKTSFRLRPSITKTRRGRTVYVHHPQLRQALTDWLGQRGAAAPEAPLFCSERGRAFTGNTLQQLFRRHFTRAGIAEAKSHSGRVTFATTLLENGGNIRDVQTLMGHASVSMTAHYVKRNQRRMARLTERAWPMDWD